MQNSDILPETLYNCFIIVAHWELEESVPKHLSPVTHVGTKCILQMHTTDKNKEQIAAFHCILKDNIICSQTYFQFQIIE